MCYYCKWKGHVKTECPALAKKICQNALVAPPRLNDVDLNPDVMGQEKIPDVRYPLLALEGRPITILSDTGASQSLVLESEINHVNVLLHGVELITISVPLHKIFLRCSLKTGLL